jgi:putative ABC transport system permease protein
MKRNRHFVMRRLFRLRAQTGAESARDVDEEMRVHIALRVEQLMGEGWGAEAAEAEARRLFASSESTLRSLRATAWGRKRRMRFRERRESWLQDTRYAARGLARDPGLSVFVIVTLSLGMGLNLTSLSLLDRLLLRDPAHVIEPTRLLRIYGTVTTPSVGAQTSAWIPWPVYEAVSDGMTSFETVSAYRVRDDVVGRGASARRLRIGQTTGPFFEQLGVRPLRGRFFGGTEDAGTAGPLAVIGEGFWESVLDADPDVIGRTIRVNDVEHTIVGIAPAGFSGTEVRRIDVWVLADTRTANTMNWKIVGRLRPGATAASATSEAMSIFTRTRDTAPRWYRDAALFAASVRNDDAGKQPFEATMAKWLEAVSAVILVVALANVVNLLLVRLARRRRELAVRVALGSGRARVVRLLALEGTLLALAAGAVSLWVVRLCEPVLQHTLLGEDASWTFSLLDARVMGAMAAAVVVTALVVGLGPALQAGSRHVAVALRAGEQGGGAGSPRLRGVLTVVQSAVSVSLLVGAGLFLRSLRRVEALDLGIDRDRVIAASAGLPEPTSFTREAFGEARRREIDVYRRLEAAVVHVPGVERAGIAVGLPLDGGSFAAAVFVAGMDSVPALPGGGPYASAVSPGYFETAGTSLLQGRTFTESDREGGERVIIVGRTMAERLWPGRDPLGGCVRIGRADLPCYRVVGIVEDVHRVGLREQPSLQYYVPLGQQEMFSGATLLVRGSRPGSVSWPELRRTMLGVDPAIRIVELRWLRDALDGEMRPLRLGGVTFGLSGALALLVAVLGLYSLMSYMVAWRTREIGVRLAIGASGPQITRMVIGAGTGLAALGIAIGLLLAAWSGRFVQPYLFETRAFDPLVFGGVALTLLVVAVFAGWLPARRALAISPTEALRAE